MQMHSRTGLFTLSMAAIAATPALAEVETKLSVDPGSSAVVQIRLEVDTFVGGDNGTDTDSSSVGGNAFAELGPGNEEFTEMTITDLIVGDMKLSGPRAGNQCP